MRTPPAVPSSFGLDHDLDVGGLRVIGHEALDLVGQVVGVEHDVLDPAVLQVADLASQDRLAANLNEDLRRGLAERAQAGATPGRQYHRVHGCDIGPVCTTANAGAPALIQPTAEPRRGES